MTGDERATRAALARLRGEIRDDREQLARCPGEARLATLLRIAPELERALDEFDSFLARAV